MMIDYDKMSWQSHELGHVKITSANDEVCAYRETHEFHSGFRLVRRQLQTQTPIRYPAFDDLDYIGVCFTFSDKDIDPKNLAFAHLHHTDMNITNGYEFAGNTLKVLDRTLYYASLQFSHSYISQLQQQQRLPSWLSQIVENHDKQLIDRIAVPPALRQLAWQICCLPKISRFSDALRVESKAIDWLAMILEMAEQPTLVIADTPSRQKNVAKKYVHGACDIIHSEFNQSLTIAELAGRVGTNECYLKQYFKQVMDMSIHEYLTQYRLTQACQLLRNHQDMNIKDVAGMCGYHPSHFSQLFYKKYGVSPKEYRQDLKITC
ncbi:helix-turn-helix transcriptional regulator [Psychrobacter sp. I-STPA6b]|uniref:helix-turn-helix transcriptional regulator n=1 Tax=Psychrobacter sp. I-STPA6b TaxID=2585718 RepID=UPI001D0C4170|nr:AraC family transcriptional regulator [Psychrobacter sp. I-STPA6b]